MVAGSVMTNDSAKRNHFELFGLPLSFELDHAQLSARYRDLQSAAHPDRFANASDHERRLSMEHATNINEAFNTLRLPLSRAQYMLELAGVVDEGESNTAMDPMFLMEQMELRERLAEVRDHSDPLTEANAILTLIGEQLKALGEAISGCFAEGGSESLQQASELVRKMQFLRRIEEEASSIEADLEDELL